MISIPVQYAYLFLSLTTVAVWVALLCANRRNRVRQIIISAVFAVAGPIGELFYIPDYWRPVTIWSVHILNSYISIEDFIFCFAIMGIMSSLPGLVLGVSSLQISQSISWITLSKIASALVAVALVSLGLWLIGLNSIFATSLAMVSVAAIILLYARQRILWNAAIIGALSMLSVMFIIYWLAFVLVSDSDSILRATWSLYGTPLGVRVLKVPLPELIWAFSFGSLFSVLFLKDRVRGLP